MSVSRVAIVTLVLIITSCSAPQEPDSRPNILFILADDLGYMDTAIYGSEFYETPNIDSLAGRGLLFRNAYASSPLCTPTRASLMTGKHPASLRITSAVGHLPEEILDPSIPSSAGPTLKAIEPESRTRLPLDATTYADILRENGYRTGFIGKWHLGPEPFSPENNGFETVVGGRQHPGPPPPGAYFAPWDIQGLRDYPAGTHIADALAQEAIEFIDDSDGRPFLLNLWFYDVHAPFQAQGELTQKYRRKLQSQPSESMQRSPTMAAMIEEFDRHVGRVVDHLEENNLLRNTVVIFASDNGGNMYDKVDGEYPTNNSPLRGGKGINYEGGVKVPLIMSWPDHLPAGASTEVRTSSIDIFPTILDIAGVKETKPTWEGTSIFELLSKGESRTRPLFFDFPHYVTATSNIPNSAVIVDDWKLYRFYSDAVDQSDRFELYNLRGDIGESADLSEENRETVEALNELIDAHLQRTEALVPQANPNYGVVTPALWRGQGGEFSSSPETIGINSNGIDPRLVATAPFTNLSAVRLTFEMKSISSGGGQIYWTSANSPAFSEQHSQHFDVRYDGEWHSYELTINHHEPLSLFRLDPSRAPGLTQLKNFRVASP